MTPTSSSPRPAIGIRAAEASDLPALEPFWRAMYAHMAEIGMQLEIPEDGYEQWSRSFTTTLGRFSAIFLASVDEKPVGFLACRVRQLPAYFGGFLVGFMTEVYVLEAYRRQGISSRLFEAGLAWYAEQDIRRIEVQVLVSNTESINLCRRFGWQVELYQMVRKSE